MTGCGLAALPIVATDGVALFQIVGESVRSFVLPSLYVPVAIKPVPFGTTREGLEGVMEIFKRTGGGGVGTKQVRVEFPTTEPTVAEMTLVPAIKQLTFC